MLGIKDELISEVLWTPTYGHTRADRPAKTYISFVRRPDAVKGT